MTSVMSLPYRVTIIGAGNVGIALARTLGEYPEFSVRLIDCVDDALVRAAKLGFEAIFADAQRQEKLVELLDGQHVVVAAGPDRTAGCVARAAIKAGVHYLDFSDLDDVEIREIAAEASGGQVFLPGCGVSPGLVASLVAEFSEGFDTIDQLVVRVGALPRFPTNRLGYGRIWNIPGLIDEYTRPCEAILDGKRVSIGALEGRENFTLDGRPYEAFVTGGGMGGLARQLRCSVQNLVFKTIRYPGHLDYIRFLLDDLGLRKRRDLLRTILMNGLPVIEDDMVLIFITANGVRDNIPVERSIVRRAGVMSDSSAGVYGNALSCAAAAHAATMIDLLRSGEISTAGVVEVGTFAARTLLENRFLASAFSPQGSC